MYIMDSEGTVNDGRECDTVQLDFTVAQYVVSARIDAFRKSPRLLQLL